MKNTTSLTYLAPRFLGTLLVLLIFAFLLELSAEEFNLNTLLIASLPGLIVLILLIIAWTKQGIGGWLFVILGFVGILYPFATASEFHLGFLLLPGWALFVGLLFLMNKSH
jgi:hypothetical protein